MYAYILIPPNFLHKRSYTAYTVLHLAFLTYYVLEIFPDEFLETFFVLLHSKGNYIPVTFWVWPLPKTSLAPFPSHLSQETLAGLEARQSESLSELITLREALESSRLEGELLRQEQTEVTAALARVRRPAPRLAGWGGWLRKLCFWKRACSLPHSSPCKPTPHICCLNY